MVERIAGSVERVRVEGGKPLVWERAFPHAEAMAARDTVLKSMPPPLPKDLSGLIYRPPAPSSRSNHLKSMPPMIPKELLRPR
jgi:hypothetical protein